MPGSGSARALRVKFAVRKRDGFRCVKCGMTNQDHVEATGKQLQVHRIDPGSQYTLEGCETVCTPCHRKLPQRTGGEPDVENPQLEGGRLTLHLPPWLRGLLTQSARDDFRPLAYQARHILALWFIHAGALTSEQHVRFLTEEGAKKRAGRRNS